MSSHEKNTEDTRPLAVGIIRVSELGDRDEERISSPRDQRKIIERECDGRGFRLVETVNENEGEDGKWRDASGAKALSKRAFGKVIERLERGEFGQGAAIVFAYRDRADRSVIEGGAAIQRIEAAGGVLVAGGQVLSHKTADLWLNATITSVVGEHFIRVIREKSADGQLAAIERGAILWSRVPLGYVKLPDATLAIDPETAPIVVEAFEMRANGASIMQVRKMLERHGITRSHRGVQVLLANRAYLGELHFKVNGKRIVHRNPDNAIIDQKLFDRVQKMIIPRGPHGSADRLLSRLGVLRCGSCDGSLGTMTMPRQKDYPIYRCPSTSVCDHHVTISAEIAERVVVDAVRAALQGLQGRASAADSARDAHEALRAAQDAYDAFTDVFDPTEPADVRRRASLKATLVEAKARVDDLPDSDVKVSAGADWDKLTRDEQRALIKAVVKRATVAPSGRGAERLAGGIEFR